MIGVNVPLYRGPDQQDDVTTNAITADDRERIADYLAKPASERDAEDLVPDDRESTGES